MATDELPPIDFRGMPTTYLSYRILNRMFQEHNKGFTLVQLSKYFAARHSDAKSICNGLVKAGFLIKDSAKTEKFRYNLKCENAERQAHLEKFLLEVELEMLNVHQMLAYSPSFRQKSMKQ